MNYQIMLSWKVMRGNGACASGLRAAFPALRKAGVAVPKKYSELEVPLLIVLNALGIITALNACQYIPDEPILRLFVADCAERALLRERFDGREPDVRSWNAVEVTRKYARGTATAEELSAARSAAGSAAGSAAWPVAWSAAKSAERKWQTARLRTYLSGQTPEPVTIT